MGVITTPHFSENFVLKICHKSRVGPGPDYVWFLGYKLSTKLIAKKLDISKIL